MSSTTTTRRRQAAGSGGTSDTDDKLLAPGPEPIPTKTLSGRQAKALQRKARYSSAAHQKPFWRSPAILVVVVFATGLFMYLAFRVSSSAPERANIQAPRPAPMSMQTGEVKFNLDEFEEAKKKEQQRDLWFVKDHPDEDWGKGVHAGRKIHRGERIMVDEAMVTLPKGIEVLAADHILDQVDKLSPADKEIFLSLSYPDYSYLEDGSHQRFLTPKSDVPLAIAQTNALAVDGTLAVFPKVARINHGCSKAANAGFSYREDQEKLYVHALRDIGKGKEILISYTNTKKPRSQRQEFLKEHYRFDCKCDVCTAPPAEREASDARLSKIRDLSEKVLGWQEEETSGVDAVVAINEIWKLSDEEGYLDERTILATNGGYIASAHADLEAAKTWYMLAAEHSIFELGSDSPQFMHNLQLAQAQNGSWFGEVWGAREKMAIPMPHAMASILSGALGGPGREDGVRIDSRTEFVKADAPKEPTDYL